MSGMPNSVSYRIALSGVFATFHLILSIIPAFPGIGGGAMSLGMISGPLVGFLLGPIYGTMSVLIGSVLGIWLNPTVPLLGPFTVIPPTIGAFVAASIRGKQPMSVILVMLVSFSIFLIGPISGIAFPFLWLHILAIILVLIFLIPKISDLFEVRENTPSNLGMLFVAIWILSFISVMADHLIGSSIGAFYFWLVFQMSVTDLEFIFMTAVILVYPIERLVMCTLLSIVLFGVDRSLASTEFRVPLIRDDDFINLELSEEDFETM